MRSVEAARPLRGTMETDGKRDRIGFLQHLSVRVTLIILAILSVGIGLTIFYYLRSQNSAIIGSREDAIREESMVLAISIKNSMLAGEAPIAVNLFREFLRTDFFAEIKLYRADGVIAFSDNVTLRDVNRRLDEERFIPKERFIARETIRTPGFIRSVKTADDVFISERSDSSRRIIAYKPLFNQPRCSACHGVDHVIRGVIKISSPVDEVYRRTRFNIALSAGIYGAVVFILLLAIVVFLDRFVITRIYAVRRVVSGVGQGDFRTKIGRIGRDEIGELSAEINRMIDGLHERFKLSKFVSRSTLDHVRDTQEIELGGEKRLVTVLFSDIRGFTAFSEGKDPELVMKVLNEVMNLQADVVHHFGGDIDKFVGDEMMAVFEGNEQAISALRTADEIRRRLKLRYTGAEEIIRVGIGVNTGEVISGNMGSGERMDHTIIGDAVNTGSRLCSIAGRNTIVISEFTYKLARDLVEVVAHGAIRVKSRRQPVKIFTLRRVL